MELLEAKKACPMCTLRVDGFHGMAGHLASRLNFAVVDQAPIEPQPCLGKTNSAVSICHNPMWHLQDLTPLGREQWYPDVEYSASN
jgi:predicted dithiol-disulfide oxidoreductase (DUF899 family)